MLTELNTAPPTQCVDKVGFAPDKDLRVLKISKEQVLEYYSFALTHLDEANHSDAIPDQVGHPNWAYLKRPIKESRVGLTAECESIYYKGKIVFERIIVP